MTESPQAGKKHGTWWHGALLLAAWSMGACAPAQGSLPNLPRATGASRAIVDSEAKRGKNVPATDAPGMVAGVEAAVSDSPLSRTVPSAEGGRDGATRPPKRAVDVVDAVPEALALARRRGRSVVLVDVWAPWCHTCLSMKHYVLPNRALNPVFERVVFATVDSDRPENQRFVASYPVRAWPTFFVLDAKDEKVIGTWEGAASVEELRRFVKAAIDRSLAADDPAVAALSAAQRALAKGLYNEASRGFERALKQGGVAWTRRSEARYGWVRSEARAGRALRCARLAESYLPTASGAALPTDMAWVALRCAQRLTDGAARKRLTEVIAARLQRQVSSPPVSASVDDRSDAMALYADVLEELGRLGEGLKVRERQVAMLEDAARKAPTPSMAATFDYARLIAYIALQAPMRAVRMLTERVKQLPDHYEPRARLAQAWRAAGDDEKALVAVQEAIDRAYGPRKVIYLSMKADLLRESGAPQDRRFAALRDVLQAFESLGATQKASGRIKRVADKARRELKKGPSRGSPEAP